MRYTHRLLPQAYLQRLIGMILCLKCIDNILYTDGIKTKDIPRLHIGKPSDNMDSPPCIAGRSDGTGQQKHRLENQTSGYELTQSFPQHLRFVTGQIHDRRIAETTRTSVDHHIHLLAELLLNGFGISVFLYHLARQ